MCCCLASELCGAAPTRTVGESGVFSSGCVCFELLELAEELVVFAVGENRRVENVVLVRRAVKRFPQLRGSCRRIRCARVVSCFCFAASASVFRLRCAR